MKDIKNMEKRKNYRLNNEYIRKYGIRDLGL